MVTDRDIQDAGDKVKRLGRELAEYESKIRSLRPQIDDATRNFARLEDTKRQEEVRAAEDLRRKQEREKEEQQKKEDDRRREEARRNQSRNRAA